MFNTTHLRACESKSKYYGPPLTLHLHPRNALTRHGRNKQKHVSHAKLKLLVYVRMFTARGRVLQFVPNLASLFLETSMTIQKRQRYF